MANYQSCKLHAIITIINVRHCVAIIGLWVTTKITPKLKVYVPITAIVPLVAPSDSRTSSSSSGRYSATVVPCSPARVEARRPCLVDLSNGRLALGPLWFQRLIDGVGSSWPPSGVSIFTVITCNSGSQFLGEINLWVKLLIRYVISYYISFRHVITCPLILILLKGPGLNLFGHCSYGVQLVGHQLCFQWLFKEMLCRQSVPLICLYQLHLWELPHRFGGWGRQTQYQVN